MSWQLIWRARRSRVALLGCRRFRLGGPPSLAWLLRSAQDKLRENPRRQRVAERGRPSLGITTKLASSAAPETAADRPACGRQLDASLVQTIRFPLVLRWEQALILVDVPSHVILFSTDACTFCVSAKSLLAKRGVVFEEVNLAEHPELQAELAEVTGLTSFPQIIVDGETIGGLNELRAADKNGTMASWSAKERE